MTTAVQRRRGTNTEHASFTGLEGEISVNTTNESVHVHDGSTAGGFELMRADGANSTVTLGDISGVTAGTGLSGGGTTGTVTLDIDGTVATLAGTQTFTNKTLTSPILNTPTIGTSFTIGGATITEAELEILDGATVTTTELNYVDGVTSAIQTQIDAKAPLASPSFTGNISVTGTVDGRDVSVDGAKLDLINQGVATTDSPTFDDGTFTGILSITPTSGYGHIEVGGVDGAFIDLKSPSSDDYDLRMITTGGNGGTIDVGSTGDLSFNAGGSERARLLSTGQVGIGTSSPSQKLTVNGTDARIYLTGANTDIDMDATANGQLHLDGNAYGFGIALNTSGAHLYTNSVSRDLIFGVNETEVMRVTDSKVGIGTTTPSSKLSIHGSAGEAYLSQTNTANSQRLELGNAFSLITGGNGSVSAIASDNTLAFATSDTERMRIDSSGNVAIGTTAPQARLHISRPTDGSEASPHFRIDGAASTYTASHWLDSNAYYIGQNSSSRRVRIYSGAETAGVSLNAGATSWGTFSDERLKYDVEPVENAVESLSNLRTVKYRLKDVDSSEDKKKLGLMAQDLVGILDEVIDPVKRTGDDTEYMSVKYTELVPVLVKAIQEQQTLIESLTARIAALEA